MIRGIRKPGFSSKGIRRGKSAPVAVDRVLAFGAGCCSGALALLVWYDRLRVADRLPPQPSMVVLSGVATLALLLILGAAIVARKSRIRRSVQEHSKSLEIALELSNDAVILIDGTNRIERLNQMAEWMFGYLEEHLTGVDVSVLLPELGFLPQGPTYRSAADPRQHQPIRNEMSGTHHDGHRFRVETLVKVFPEEARSLILIRDVDEERNSNTQLRLLQQIDPITGLLNRGEFEKRLGARMVLSDPEDGPLFLCYADVKHFKLINDVSGYAVGNQFLGELAALLRAQLKNADLLGRLGGDEFGALLSGLSPQAAHQQCQNLLQAVSSFPFVWNDQSFDVALNLAVIELAPHSRDSDRALAHAETVCRMAQQGGHGQLHLSHYGDSEPSSLGAEAMLVSSIRGALDEGRFLLVAHPIGWIAKDRWGEVPHYEILIRMLDENDELVEPNHFLPAAERYLLMPTLDRWVITELFRQQASNLRRWGVESDSFLFAINLSGMSLADPGFLRFLERQFDEWAVPHRTICFEITESVAIANMERAQNLIQTLRTAGCRFALDDFGSGLSSYAYLQELGVDVLKIDGAFVRTLVDNPISQAIVDSINQIGHILGMTTVAEWVESDAILERLRELEVDLAQGHRVGKARPLTEVVIPVGHRNSPAHSRTGEPR